MKTDELIDKIREEQKKISDAMLVAFEGYGWKLDTSRSDIKGTFTGGYTMTIDDGNCPDVVGAVFHIYGPGGKIFEGCLDNSREVDQLMKMLCLNT